jgi:hypothetical protein
MGLIMILALVGLLLAGCAAGPNLLQGVEDEQGEVAGFWAGLWHGIIAPITFVISLFSDTVQIYEVYNNGGWYNFGFILGMTMIWGGGGRSSARRRKD